MLSFRPFDETHHVIEGVVLGLVLAQGRKLADTMHGLMEFLSC